MKIILDYWSIRWRSVSFDTERGKGRVRWLWAKPGKCRGWANKFQGTWFAMWSDSSGLIFQAGKDQWYLHASGCDHKIEGKRCIFKVLHSGKSEYILEYELADKSLAFDHLDLETRDFFYWVCRVRNDASLSRELLSAWQSVEA